MRTPSEFLSDRVCLKYSPFANNEYTIFIVTFVKSNPQISLRPQDVVVLLCLTLEQNRAPTYAALAQEVCLTASEVHASIKRAVQAQLVRKDADGKPRVLLEPLKLFLLHGVRYCFPAIRGEMTRGLPTGYAAPPLEGKIVAGNEPAPVWPDKNGPVRGMTFQPLYPTVPQAARKNAQLYELLVLTDALRGGSPRERALAQQVLETRFAT